MKLEKPIKISESTLESLEFSKKKILFLDKTGFIILSDFEIEWKTEKKSFWKFANKIETNIYITSIEVWVYNHEKEFWGTIREQSLSNIVWMYDFRTLRKNYEDKIQKPLAFLDFEIKKTEKNPIVFPDPYAGELNTERIAAYQKLKEEYRIEESSIRRIFCKGVDWYKQQLEEQKHNDSFNEKVRVGKYVVAPGMADFFGKVQYYVTETNTMISVVDYNNLPDRQKEKCKPFYNQER